MDSTSSGAVARIALDDLGFVGGDLRRPECVLAAADGTVFTSNWDGGVSRIAPDGTTTALLAADDRWLRPNGIALRRTGSFLTAHLGDDDGGVFELFADGTLAPLLTEIDGVDLPPTNFVTIDERDRIWITVSTRLRPRALGYRSDVDDGFLVVIDGRGARIAADGLGYTNEAQLHPDGRHLYVNETFARRLSRFRVGDDGSLGPRSTVCEFGAGTFPDGLAFDEAGGVWITSIISNRVIRVDPEGGQTLIVADADPDALADVEDAFQAGRLDRTHLAADHGRRLTNISSLCFGGPGRRTAYLGCLTGRSVATFPSPIAGVEPHHWRVKA
ncbi:MAG: SMP-30/gluconolactonase/LRE family protein [Actinomycetota bacterium]